MDDVLNKEYQQEADLANQLVKDSVQRNSKRVAASHHVRAMSQMQMSCSI